MMVVEKLVEAAFLVGLATSIYLWVWSIRRVNSGQVLLPFAPRRPVPWSFLDTLLVLMGFFVVQYVTAVITLSLTDQTTISKEYLALIVSSCVLPVFLATAIVQLMNFRGANWRDLGVDLRYAWFDLIDGVYAFAMLASIVFTIQAALQSKIEYEHPILDMLADHDGPWPFITAFLAAVVVAPLVEEFLFRVVLQGALEKLAYFWAMRQENPDLSLNSIFGTLIPANQRHDVIRIGSWWPILASASIFAILHAGQGAAPIPLFFLAVGMGYLYQRTHRILSCVVVHAMLNGISLLAVLVDNTA